MHEGTVRYTFKFSGEEFSFDVDSKSEPLPVKTDYPDWTRLTYHQCECCPLKRSEVRYCPAATKIHSLITEFSDKISTERANVSVHTNQRTYLADVDLQVGVNSLLGLLMAKSGCPVLKPLKTMADFHIPFCSTRETLFRTIGAYLTQQFFIRKNGGDPDWDLEGLSALYNDLEGLNRDFSERIKGLISGDVMVNAIILFFATSVVVNTSLEQHLDDEEGYFTGSDTPQ